jgi:hypothetical protein
VGQWQSTDGKTLTIGDKFTSGEYRGKYNCNYIAAGDGILIGIGEDRGDGSFRLALKTIGTDEKAEYKAANLVRVGDSVRITWDKGGTDTLDRVG